MARYLLAALGRPSQAAQPPAAFDAELAASGRLIVAAGLASPDDAVTVTPEGQLGDGPAQPAGPHVRRFGIVDVDNRSAAEALAVRAASACGCSVELRLLKD
ncbi:hypothetical protein [Corynebacterium uterequi]|uniref:YCII-related domain-containing protein n=1 Tax=Corynebacterium uterequi TaxID=1072256 RepID=A0A0G3H9T6_9CORY|nr:hypothetical protein [Corynebacterium uterequi]AKK10099.1 hypothetical protein CUTER_00350 [Corynebacterium uterequi]